MPQENHHCNCHLHLYSLLNRLPNRHLARVKVMTVYRFNWLCFWFNVSVSLSNGLIYAEHRLSYARRQSFWFFQVRVPRPPRHGVAREHGQSVGHYSAADGSGARRKSFARSVVLATYVPLVLYSQRRQTRTLASALMTACLVIPGAPLRCSGTCLPKLVIARRY